MLIIKSLFAVSFLTQLSIRAAPIPLYARAPSSNDDAAKKRTIPDHNNFFQTVFGTSNAQHSTAGKLLASSCLACTWSMADHFNHHTCRGPIIPPR